MAKTNGSEQYLEAIYILTMEGETVLGSVLADFLGVSRPTVTQTIKRLSTAGMVTMEAGKEIVLTPAGTAKAESVLRRHRLLERWLTDELGLDWAEAHIEAGRLENVVSPLLEQRLYEHLGRPVTCPHGNVIPGTNAHQAEGIRLSDVATPTGVTVLRIFEHADEDLALLKFLYHARLVPGASIDLKEPENTSGDWLSLEVDGLAYCLRRSIADHIFVQPQPTAVEA